MLAPGFSFFKCNIQTVLVSGVLLACSASLCQWFSVSMDLTLSWLLLLLLLWVVCLFVPHLKFLFVCLFVAGAAC